MLSGEFREKSIFDLYFLRKYAIIQIGGFVAQLVRALPCHGRGREFESRRIRHMDTPSGVFFVVG